MPLLGLHSERRRAGNMTKKWPSTLPGRVTFRFTISWPVMIGLLLLAASASTDNEAAAATSGPVTQDQVLGIVHVCTSCHGEYGRSISPTFPNLAGQQAAYIQAQLTAFRDHKRSDPHAQTYMWGMAAHLSNDIIHSIATYFAAQMPAPGEPGDPHDMAAGKQIYQQGIPARQVPACHACHGDHAQGLETIPRLAGQHREYIEKQLSYFSSNLRANEIMHENSKNLTPDEIREVATYAAAQ